MRFFNFHTHTNFCDGSDFPEEYVEKAIQLHFRAIGFSGHAPLPFENNFSIKESELENYAREIRRLQLKYQSQIEIYLSLEYDFIPGVMDDFSIHAKKIKPDYIMGSIHLVKNDDTDKLWFIDGSKREIYDRGLEKIFANNVRKAVSAFYHQTNRMVEMQKPDIIGHFDKIKMHNQNRFFSEDELWYQELVDESLGLVKASNSIIEVNTRGIYKKKCNSLFPGIMVLKKIKNLNIPVTISSDAHKPNELNSYFMEAVRILREIGFKELMVLKKSGWIGQKI